MASPAPAVLAFKKEVPLAELPSRIHILHPFRNVRFLNLPVRHCLLPDNRRSADGCIPLTAVLDACAIVTGAASEGSEQGVLSRDSEGNDSVDVRSGLVDAGVYYYIHDVNDPRADYPIFHSFDEWVPPPRERVPKRWFTAVYPRVRPGYADMRTWNGVEGREESTLCEKVVDIRTANARCRASRYQSRLRTSFRASTATGLYQRRDVVRQLSYPQPIPDLLSDGPDLVHDLRNLLTFRTDLRTRWDAHAFVLIPVPTTSVQDSDRDDGQVNKSESDFMAYVRVPLPETRMHIDRGPEGSDEGEGAEYSAEWANAVDVDAVELAEEVLPVALEGFDPRPDAVMDDDDDAAQSHSALDIIGWFQDVDHSELPPDLAAAWTRYLDAAADGDAERDMDWLRREWQGHQEPLRRYPGDGPTSRRG
ncbi:hypothetical protein L226DRAFT_607971 [Lentinus tigrinus ALCF2SS1-7]|uniref:HNH nuclease domain-containing protein n=1 Tax=Lentinus tigrinus ALCF2SS1-6 TaxID=1328759 RepID=A0A5C2SLR3_9APHY|nr:hypothetical protein L227DRAFT_649765 [Lentinus tigrinus ALCF2SS1-6]RPD82945.1 hypothetical protein L226DRAFT_607971 [Lentinus tigrinus ALCF2SS1-7]